MIKAKRWTCIVLYVGILCALLTSCAHFSKDGNTVWGIGKQERDAEGKILKVECNSPVEGIFSIFGMGR